MHWMLCYVKTVNPGVCGSYTIPYTEYYEVWELYSTLYKVASHPYQEGRLILKTKGVLSNLVILRYLWEQSCILHTLTKLPVYCNFDSKSVFSAWRSWACRVPLEVAGSVSDKVGSHKQVDLPIHRLQLWMLWCQLTHTHLGLIAHTWPVFDQSRSCTPCEIPTQSSKRLVLAWLIE